MQIERHRMPDGSEEVRRKIFDAMPAGQLRGVLGKAYRKAAKQETLVEIKQVQFDPENDRCPCGSRKLAKNCCAKAIVRRIAAQRKAQARKEPESIEGLNS